MISKNLFSDSFWQCLVLYLYGEWKAMLKSFDIQERKDQESIFSRYLKKSKTAWTNKVILQDILKYPRKQGPRKSFCFLRYLRVQLLSKAEGGWWEYICCQKWTLGWRFVRRRWEFCIHENVSCWILSKVDSRGGNCEGEEHFLDDQDAFLKSQKKALGTRIVLVMRILARVIWTLRIHCCLFA